jgi:ice-binding like protein/Big-like domain-containing protein
MPRQSFRKGGYRVRAPLIAALLMHLACGGEELAHGRVAVVGRSAQSLTSATLESVNGSYGGGCVGRADAAWSLEIQSDVLLDDEELSVIQGNTACVLTLTSLRTTGGVLTAVPPIVLSASFALNASTFGVPLGFYAVASLDDPTFAGDFELTILYSDDAAVAGAINTAVPQPPTVVAFTPADDALNVTIAQRPTATFSVDMDPTTLDDAFTLQLGMTTVPGVVSYDAATDTATFTPDTALELDSTYDVVITTDAENIRHTPLASSHGWTFTTAEVSQGPINLRSASSFVVLAGSTVTNTGLTDITGDVGVSPGTAVTGFPPGVITGALHAADASAALAQVHLTTAYDDAEARVLGSVPKNGDLGGVPLPPGLYSSSSSLEINSVDLTLDAGGEVDAVFLFQMSSTLTVAANRQVVLINGAKAANVYWQVGSSATLGTGSAFAGTIMADTSITLTTGATLDGRALARDGVVTLDANDIDRPAP